MPLHSLLFQVSDDWLMSLISDWLDVRSMGILDAAITNIAERLLWLKYLKKLKPAALNEFTFSHSSIRWLIDRHLSTTGIQIRESKENEITEMTFEGICVPSMRTIDLHNCASLTDAGLVTLARGCKQLQSMKLACCRNIFTTGSLEGLAFEYRELRSIDISRCANVTDDCLSDIGLGCPQLESIDLTNCQYITDDGLTSLAGGCPLLQSVILCNCYRLTDSGIEALANHLPDLQVLDLTRCRDMTDRGIDAITRGCPKLQSLDLNRIRNVTDRGLTFLALRCSDLRFINLNRCRRVTDQGLQFLAAGCLKLQRIILEDNGVGVTEAGTAALRIDFPELTVGPTETPSDPVASFIAHNQGGVILTV